MEISASERDRLFADHRHLCRLGARKFLRRGLERADLEQVAAIGLLKARDRYDGREATPFATYAWRLILGELSHHVRDREHFLRPPRRLQALERRYAAEWERLSGLHGREPRDDEIAGALGTTLATASDLRRLPTLRCAFPAQPDGHSELETPRNGSSLLAVEDLLWLKDALARLSPLERRVVVGIYWCELPRTVLGRKLGLRPGTVANLQNRAIRTLRRYGERGL